MCDWPEVDLQVEGSPCVDWSSVGKCQGRQGPNSKALLSALFTVARSQPRCYIHENVPNFDVSIIEAVLGQMYNITTIEVSPADAGHVECGRSRVYTVCVHKTRCNVLMPVDLMYYKMLMPLMDTVVEVEDVWREKNPARLLKEMSTVENRLKNQRVEDIVNDWTPLLTEFEASNLAKYEEIWEQKHKVQAKSDASAAYTLMQDATTHTTMVNKEAGLIERSCCFRDVHTAPGMLSGNHTPHTSSHPILTHTMPHTHMHIYLYKYMQLHAS